ncbi:SDR family oxidoreductase [Methanolobus mangrovi]|uniref:SDR family oxidoreductase n=1 Tax=Methanolobus mangrovi TaxID=3072977 RepID=A0AA51UGZ5_9EURY|nr:SDR family oxidoreductase [Methanolobus mangrovi]WMW23038.1 SDR family oxidoreductase [Methanolobus mangrovi]
MVSENDVPVDVTMSGKNDFKAHHANSVKRTALITGGAGGIGQELAKLFARDSYNLVLVDRNEEDLESAKNKLHAVNPDIRILLLEQDLTSQDAAKKVYEFTQKHDLQINVLVNCAGFGTYGFVNDIDDDRELDMLQLHVINLYRMTRLYLKDMVERNEGQIINMSSISAFQPNPYFATYGASKSFVLQFSRALNYELKEKGLNVKVLAVCPTAVKDTGFKAFAGMEHTRAFRSWMVVNASIVARDTYLAMECDRDLVIPGRGFGLLQRITSRLPVSLLMRISRSELKETAGFLSREMFTCSSEKGADQ